MAMFEWVTPSIWRRMLRAAWEQDLGLAGVRDAIVFWNAHFAQAQDYQKHIRPFAEAFSEYLGKTETRTQMALRLIGALHTKLEFLPKDPIEVATTTDKNTRSELIIKIPTDQLPQTTPVDASLSELLSCVRDQLALQSKSATLFSELDQWMSNAGVIQAMNLDPKQRLAWRVWLTNPQRNTLHALFSAAQAQIMVNQWYIFLSTELGPVMADQVLSQAVKSAELSAAGRVLSPRTFL
jgi:hypothetical protein